MKRLLALVAVLGAAATLAAAALASAPPVGRLPTGPVQTVERPAGGTFTVTLPRPGFLGRQWRVARAFDSNVVREVAEGTKQTGDVWATYRTVAPGATWVVYALTRGETSYAYASRAFHVVVTRSMQGVACPNGLLPLTANPIGPAVAAALAGDPAKNRPQATGAAVASNDAGRGPQVKAACGADVQARTVVVYVTDRALLPSQSASQRVLFVGRTKTGYHVWERAH